MGSKIRILNYMTVDSLGQRIEPEYGKLVGKPMRHTGNGKVYVVHGFAWNGDKDEWMFLASEASNLVAIMVARSLSHLYGKRDNGEPRYVHLQLAE